MDTLLKVFTVEELVVLQILADQRDSHVSEDCAPAFSSKRTRNGKVRRNPANKCDAPWQRMLDSNDAMLNSIHDESSRDGMYFRRRFRVPYSLFKDMVSAMLEEKWFPKYGPNCEGPLDASKNRGASLQVKVLSVLRVLGRGVVFDECYDGSGCGEESIRVFFHSFVAVFSQRLFAGIIKPPKTEKEIRQTTGIYQTLGMGAAIGSTDCTHISLGNCPNNFRVSCTGKSGKPTMAYSLTCDHAKKILFCSPGFMGTKNDKHISKLDSFITAVNEREEYKNFEWTIDVSETLTEQRKGVFLICDGGYHKWRHMICGLKVRVRIC